MAHRLHPGCAVVVLAQELGPMLPAAAVPALRGAAAVFADPTVAPETAAACGAEPVPEAGKLARLAESEPVVLLTTAQDA
ncbi:MAG TPA: hypothetical protein VFM37_09285, partial [Pseudonocardiaceae bacterium]|nr:hypothetical protein [Pseudonocardiaceae bacterium]